MWARWIAWLHDPRCVLCDVHSKKPLCAKCRAAAPLSARSPGGIPLLSLGRYQAPLSSRIQRLKYYDETIIVERLGSALAEIFPPCWKTAELVPVPLHPERLAERGYNQSALLARQVGRRLGIQTNVSSLRRTENTKAQARLSLSERCTNVAGAFVCARLSVGRSVVLIDDVTTSGTTLDACARSIDLFGGRVLGAVSVALGGQLTPTGAF